MPEEEYRQIKESDLKKIKKGIIIYDDCNENNEFCFKIVPIFKDHRYAKHNVIGKFEEALAYAKRLSSERFPTFPIFRIGFPVFTIEDNND